MLDPSSQSEDYHRCSICRVDHPTQWHLEEVVFISSAILFTAVNFLQTLTWSKVPEDSSDFDDSVCVFIVMTWSFIWDTLRFFRPKLFSESRRPSEIIFRIPPAEIFSRIPPADFFSRIPSAGRIFFPESRRPFFLLIYLTFLRHSFRAVVFLADGRTPPDTINRSRLYYDATTRPSSMESTGAL